MIPLCVDQGVGVIPWSPLARGFLAGNRKPGGTGDTVRAKTDPMARNMYFRDSDFAVADATVQVARERGVTPAQIACAWIMRAPGVTAPIIGATKLNHVKELMTSVDIKLTKEEVTALEAPYQPHPVLGFESPRAGKMLG